MEVIILVIVITFLIGKAAIEEGRRIEEHNKFIKNLNKYDKKKKAGKLKSKI